MGIFATVVLLLLLIIEFGFVSALAFLVPIKRKVRVALISWGVFTVFALCFFLFAKYSNSDESVQYRNYFYITTLILLIYLPKAIFSIFHLINWLLCKLIRRKVRFISLIGAGLAFVFFGMTIYGIFYGRRDFVVKQITITSDKIPASFDGFKIAQVSDMHLGSYSDTTIVSEGLNILQKQNPDIFIFTGDMINSNYSEMKDFVGLFRRLKMPFGKFSILGNHDMGDYRKWYDKNNRETNYNMLLNVENDCGLQVLGNRHVYIKKGADSIVLAGVLNWGKPPFRRYGNLKLALKGLPNSVFTILASHDPSHWRAEVLPDGRADLTLAGHTHGMQMGINTSWFKWSPVEYKYHEWSGLYHEKNQYLYVNQGFGEIGFFARIGIRPEITIITLKRAGR